MVEFEKNVNEILPYNRQQYISFNDINSTFKWYGVSFQLPGASEGRRITITKYIQSYNNLFKNVVLYFDSNYPWIVNHDDKDMKWLPNDDHNLPLLRALFKQRKITNNFKGALIFTKDDLLSFSKDLISYPYVVLSKQGFLYKNLDISHSNLQFIIKISGHLNIDFISTNKELLNEIVNKYSSNSFIVKEYRETALT